MTNSFTVENKNFYILNDKLELPIPKVVKVIELMKKLGVYNPNVLDVVIYDEVKLDHRLGVEGDRLIGGVTVIVKDWSVFYSAANRLLNSPAPGWLKKQVQDCLDRVKGLSTDMGRGLSEITMYSMHMRAMAFSGYKHNMLLHEVVHALDGRMRTNPRFLVTDEMVEQEVNNREDFSNLEVKIGGDEYSSFDHEKLAWFIGIVDHVFPIEDIETDLLLDMYSVSIGNMGLVDHPGGKELVMDLMEKAA